ncbi:unnamed protein product, partial [Meganyctiphanes norvegica]
MTTFSHVTVSVILLQLTSPLSGSPVTTSIGGGEHLRPQDLINQQVKELRDHCSRPQKQLLKLCHVLSNNSSDLLAGDYYELIENCDMLLPSLLLVNRCSSKCSHAGGITCTPVEEKNVERVFHIQDKENGK